MKRTRFIIVCLAMATCISAGCSRRVHGENPVLVAATDYDAVFNSTLVELRNLQFEITRKDRRFGLISTKPRTAPTIIEVWHKDNTTAKQAFVSTLNHDQRKVRVTLSPTEEGNPASSYALGVEVEVMRWQTPPRSFTTSAVGRASVVRDRSPFSRSVRTERGVEEGFWRTVGRDEYLEHRIIEKIMAGKVTPGPAVDALHMEAPESEVEG